MHTNTDSESINVTRYARIGCREHMDSLRRVLDRSTINPFNITKVVEDTLCETTLRYFNGNGSSIRDILADLRHYRVDRVGIMEALIDFEDFLHKSSQLKPLRESTVVDAKFIYDTPSMEIEYHETVQKEGPLSFGRFIRESRRNGDVIHPEVEKALRAFRLELDHNTTLQWSG